MTEQVGAGSTGVPAGLVPAEPVLVDARQSLGPAMLDDLFPEGDAFRRSLQTYVVLLALASFIAAFGLYQDSTASIIGAMVVAPLGGAIMALAGALVTGRSRWLWISLLQVLLGSLMVVAIGYLVSFVMPDLLTLTPALEARTSPGLLDLGVALAAGAAGAYVAARRTGSDALPGVAIAVSLVPPLATVGICLELGRPSDAAGALVLFLTNVTAIVVVASIVFVASGAAPSGEMLRERHRLRTGFILALVGLALVTIPLARQAIEVGTATIRSTQGAPYVRAWLAGTDLEVTEWSIDGDTVSLHLTGVDDPPDAAPLAHDLAGEYGSPVRVDVTWTQVTKDHAESAP